MCLSHFTFPYLLVILYYFLYSLYFFVKYFLHFSLHLFPSTALHFVQLKIFENIVFRFRCTFSSLLLSSLGIRPFCGIKSSRQCEWENGMFWWDIITQLKAYVRWDKKSSKHSSNMSDIVIHYCSISSLICPPVSLTPMFSGYLHKCSLTHIYR